MEEDDDDDGEDGILATLNIWEPCQPIDRGERYEDPLEAAFPERVMVDGGGSLLSDLGEIEEVDVELQLRDEGVVEDIALLAAQLGVPKGSTLSWEIGEETFVKQIGHLEGIAVYLQGSGLPDEVYESTDINAVCTELADVAATVDHGEWRTHWEGPAETALYFYASSADELWKALEPVLKELPIAQNARVVWRVDRGNPEPKTLRVKK